MFPGIPPARDPHPARVFLCNSIVTGLHWFIIFRTVNISYRVSSLQSFTYLTYTLRTSVTIFFTKLLEIYNILELLIKYL